ncbi:MAG: helix-turn-helix transcriptional regulator [Neptuniibacter sp.]
MAGTSGAIIVGRQPLFMEGIAILLRESSFVKEVHKLDPETSPEDISSLNASIIIFCCANGADKPEDLLSRFTLLPEAEFEKIIVFCPLISAPLRTILAESGILVLPLAVDMESGKAYLKEYLRNTHSKVEYKAAGDAKLNNLFLPDFDNLTVREKEVLLNISHGYSNADIAEKMNIHINTVKVHVQKICRKIEVQNRTEAASNYSKLINAGYI